MLFVSFEDFVNKAKEIPLIGREEDVAYAKNMSAGVLDARDHIIRGYLPYVAAHVRRLRKEYQSLELVLRCCVALEKAVDQFDFLQDSESFAHRLSWWLRQTVTRYIADTHKVR